MLSSSYFHVTGMTCGSCSAAITSTLSAMPKVHDVSVSVLTEEAKVVHDESVTVTSLVSAIESCGFDASLVKTEHGVAAVPGRAGAEVSKSGSSGSNTNTTETVSKYTVGGMTCGACAASITASIEAVSGVLSATVSLLTEEALVQHSPAVTPAQIIQSVQDCGFDASLISATELTLNLLFQVTKVAVSGMSCGSCTATINNALEAHADVLKASVSLVTEEASIEHSASLTAEGIVDIIRDCGFDAHVVSSVAKQAESAVIAAESTKECVLFEIVGITDHVDLVGLQYNMEARLAALPGILTKKIAFSISPTSENPYMATDANSSIIQEIRPESDMLLGLDENALDELFIEYDPRVVGIRDIFDAMNGVNEDILFVLINSLDQSSLSQLKLLSRTKEIKYWRSTFFLSIAFGIPVIVMAHTQHLPFWKNLIIFPGLYLVSILQFALAFYVQFYLASPFLAKFLKFIRNGGKNASMDVLVSISTLVTFSFSIFAMGVSVWRGQKTKPPKVLFETVCMLVFFISMGKWLENQAKGATSSALSKLLSLTPSTCTIIEDLDGYDNLLAAQEKSEKSGADLNNFSNFLTREISIDLIQTGDISVILPGAKVPADGVVVLGETEIDESFVTGESLPVFKTTGDAVIGGSVNGAGVIHVRVIHTGKNSQLQQIINLVKDSQINKAPVQGFADYVASRFVPMVLILSISTFLVWTILCFILHNDSLPKAFNMEENGKFFVCLKLSISVVVVACPCALGLAAPTAMMVGTGVGASNGVLIKGGDVLEKASKVDIILFDKTGTLTTGGMNVTHFEKFPAKSIHNMLSEKDWWRIIGSIENNSEHPIGVSLTKKARSILGKPTSNEKLAGEGPSSEFETSISNFKVFPGMGIKSTVELKNGKRFDVSIGNQRMLVSEYATNSLLQTELANTMNSYVVTDSLAFVVINDELSGYVTLADKIKPQARAVVEYLQYEQNMVVGIVTGDNKLAAAKIGNELGIPECNIFSEVSPINKDKVISDIKARFGGSNGSNVVVAFVGDGINDAPALAQADVGMAISSGSDIAIESANIVLMGSKNEHQCDLYSVPIALDISKVTFRKIKTNFIWAAIYNVVMLPFAMGCFLKFNLMLPPIAAAASMAVSSVSVVVSSLFLKSWKVPEIKSSPKRDVNEEDVGLVFSLKTSTIDDFDRMKKKSKIWTSIKKKVSNDQHEYEMINH